MNTVFANLKNSRQSSFDKLTKKLQDMSKKGFQDDRFWTPTFTKAKTASAIIRFLPAPPGEEDPFVRVYSHAFTSGCFETPPRKEGMWYIENSLTTIGKDDPVSEMNTKLWAQGKNSPGQKIVSGSPEGNVPGTKRKVNYYANIYIVADPEAPQNVGQVKLYKFGAQIYEKIDTATHPKYDEYVAFDPFDMWNGANLKLRIAPNKGGYPQYTESEWDLVDENGKKVPRGALSTDEQLLETIWKSEHSLQAFLKPDQFKSYNDLKARLSKVMGVDQVAPEEFKQATPPWEAEENTSAPSNETEVNALDDELEMFKALRD